MFGLCQSFSITKGMPVGGFVAMVTATDADDMRNGEVSNHVTLLCSSQTIISQVIRRCTYVGNSCYSLVGKNIQPFGDVKFKQT